MDDFQDKVVLITGAGRGLGRALAEAFARGGAIVAANDITPINLDVTLANIQAAGGRARDYIFDVGKLMTVNSLVEAVMVDWGRIDILINCAGVMPRASILTMDEWDWWRTLDVNLTGPFFTMQRVGRVMAEAGGGIMVNIAGDVDRPDGWPEQAAFRASKHGLLGLTEEARRELGGHGIRVFAVTPRWSSPGKADEASLQEALEQVLRYCRQPDLP